MMPIKIKHLMSATKPPKIIGYRKDGSIYLPTIGGGAIFSCVAGLQNSLYSFKEVGTKDNMIPIYEGETITIEVT